VSLWPDFSPRGRSAKRGTLQPWLPARRAAQASAWRSRPEPDQHRGLSAKGGRRGGR